MLITELAQFEPKTSPITIKKLAQFEPKKVLTYPTKLAQFAPKTLAQFEAEYPHSRHPLKTNTIRE